MTERFGSNRRRSNPFDVRRRMGNSQRHQREQLSKGKYVTYNRSSHLHGVVRRTCASFVNRSTETLKFIWLDFDGNPQQYHVVRPGRKYHVYTYNTHQWVAEDLSGTVWASHVYGAFVSFREDAARAAVCPNS